MKRFVKSGLYGIIFLFLFAGNILGQTNISLIASVWNEDGKPITTGTVYFQATNSPTDSVKLNGSNIINTTITGINTFGEHIPQSYHLISQNYPNPFNPGTITRISPETDRIIICNVLGQTIADIAGPGKNHWTNTRITGTIPAGIYFISAIDEERNHRQTIKAVLTDGGEVTFNFTADLEGRMAKSGSSRKTGTGMDSIKIWTKIPGHEKNNNYTIIRKPGQKMNEINLGQSNYNKNTGKVDTAKISLEELINTINEKGEIRIYCISDTALNDTIKSQMVPNGDYVRRFTQPYTIEIYDFEVASRQPLDTNTINKMIEINEDFKETMRLTNGDTLITFNYLLIDTSGEGHETVGTINRVYMYRDASEGYSNHSEFFLDPNNPFRTTGGVNITVPSDPYSVIAEEYYGNHLRRDGLVGGLAAYIIAGEGMYEVRLNNKGKKALRTLYLLNPGSKVPPIGYDATQKR